MRVLVTGGAGFIGSHVVTELLADGHAVRVCDRHRAPRSGDVEMVTGDLADAGVARAAVDGVDAVCHQAARVGLGLDFGDAPDYAWDNDLATARLLAALRQRQFDGRLVLASSMVVYGEGRYRCLRHGRVRPGPRTVDDLENGRFEPPCPQCRSQLSPELVPEDAATDPRSIYAITKLTQELLCTAWARETGGTVVALRYHNVYGLGLPRDTPYAGVAALFLSALARDQAPTVFEDGQQRRDFVHVRDVARANALALEVTVGSGTAVPVNVCSGHPRSVGDLARDLAEIVGPGRLRPVITGQYRLGDVRHVVASPERARQLLGFEAQVRWEDGLAELAAATVPHAQR